MIQFLFFRFDSIKARLHNFQSINILLCSNEISFTKVGEASRICGTDLLSRPNQAAI